jgi:hypothetical protein
LISFKSLGKVRYRIFSNKPLECPYGAYKYTIIIGGFFDGATSLVLIQTTFLICRTFHRYISMAASNLGSRIVSFGQQLRYFFGQLNYLFWTANLFFWAARLIIWAAKFIEKAAKFINGQQLFSLLNFR